MTTKETEPLVWLPNRTNGLVPSMYQNFIAIHLLSYKKKFTVYKNKNKKIIQKLYQEYPQQGEVVSGICFVIILLKKITELTGFWNWGVSLSEWGAANSYVPDKKIFF